MISDSAPFSTLNLRTYRRDIDGLRALAVLGVILFHAEIPGFSGGYVGVDVFFVISGFLITQLLAPRVNDPLKTLLGGFYKRRARRILPALCVTSLIVAAASVAILMPWDLATLGRYLVATPLFWINVTAWHEGAGYFASKTLHVPIAHFWSIAIEEQFYVVFPITFALLCRFLPHYRKHVIAALMLASLALCIWASYYAYAANYFLAPSRAWELLLGAALTLSTRRVMNSQPINELLALSALMILIFAVHCYSSTTRYPGLFAIAPCAASALLIETGRHQSTLVNRLLSVRPLVFTGLISYSLYLWHYPILVLAAYYNVKPLGAFGIGAALLATYAVAAASWRWVERPVRAGAVLGSTRTIICWAVIANAAILGTGILFWKSEGLPTRFPPERRVRGNAWLFDSNTLSKCADLPFARIASGSLCSFGPQNDEATRILVWGDSHAMALMPAYEELARLHHVRVYFAIRSSCRPLVGVINKKWSDNGRIGCAGFNSAAAQAVRLLDPQVLILNAHWIDADADLVSQATDIEPGESNFSRGLRDTLRQTGSAKRSVCIVMDVPEFKYDLPTAVGVARKRGIAEDFLTVTNAEARNQFLGPERDIRLLARRGLLHFVDPKTLLCREDLCRFEANGTLLYGDGDHLSFAGAQFVQSAIDGCFQDIGLAKTTE